MRMRLALGFGLLLAVAGCRGTPLSISTLPLTPTSTFPAGVAAFVQAVQTVEPSPVDGATKDGHPAVSAGGLAVTVTGEANVVAGGATIAALNAATPFQKVFVTILNAGAVIDGFYEVDLPAPVTDKTMLVRFVTAVPAPAFTVRFQVSTLTGVPGPAATIDSTVVSTVASVIPAVVASFDPNPASFLNGAPCPSTNELGCLYEFRVKLREFNGLGVSPATLTETFTFPSGTTVRQIPVVVPGNGTGIFVRTLACGTATISCLPLSDQAGGTYTFSVDGTDLNGNPFSFVGPTLTLSGK
jgi:hypothetical protein